MYVRQLYHNVLLEGDHIPGTLWIPQRVVQAWKHDQSKNKREGGVCQVATVLHLGLVDACSHVNILNSWPDEGDSSVCGILLEV